MTTLQAKYNEHYTEIRNQLHALKKALKKHSKKQQAEADNWCYVGDLGYVRRILGELDVFIKSAL